jgi:hypothetical protein
VQGCEGQEVLRRQLAGGGVAEEVKHGHRVHIETLLTRDRPERHHAAAATPAARGTNATGAAATTKARATAAWHRSRAADTDPAAETATGRGHGEGHGAGRRRQGSRRHRLDVLHLGEEARRRALESQLHEPDDVWALSEPRYDRGQVRVRLVEHQHDDDAQVLDTRERLRDALQLLHRLRLAAALHKHLWREQSRGGCEGRGGDGGGSSLVIGGGADSARRTERDIYV